MAKLDFDRHKLIYHPKEVSKFLAGEMFAPIYVEIGPINACNHHCSFCALDYIPRKGEKIKSEVLFKTIQNMSDFGVKSIMFAGEGEPLLYPELSQAIDIAKTTGLDISITTNGVLFTLEKAKLMLRNLSWIKFSVDAGSKEAYAKIHGTKEEDFDILLRNIKDSVLIKKKEKLDVTIGTQIIVTEESIAEIEKIIKVMKDISPDYLVIKPYSQNPNSINKHKLDLNHWDEILRDLAIKYSDENFQVMYRELAFSKVEEEVEFNQCNGIYFYALLEASGNIVPCHLYSYNDDFSYGNINENTFEEIWKSKKRQDVLKKLKEMGCKNCRKGCRLTFINKYLDELVEKKVKHVNFI